MTKKLTKKEKYNMLLAIEEVKTNPVLVEFINHELDLLAKKNASSTGEKKLTARQTENIAVKEIILSTLRERGKMTVTEILKANAETFEPMEMSNQRLSRLLVQLKDAGLVIRTEEKRKAYFSISE